MWAMGTKWYHFLHVTVWRTCKGAGLEDQRFFIQRAVATSFSLHQSQSCMITVGHELVNMSYRCE